MSNKHYKQKLKTHKTATRPTPANPSDPNLKHNTPEASAASTKSKHKKFRKTSQPSLPVLILIGAAALALIAAVIFLINRPPANANSMSETISVDEAYQKYLAGTFVLDVRTQEEWDEYHAPNTTLIPLDELESRLNELPKDEEIVVICRSGNRSQQGRDILLKNGFAAATSMEGGLKAWSAAGYPIEGTRP